MENDSPYGTDAVLYFPAILCAEFDSPLDALLGLHVALGEAMDALAAAWANGETRCLLASVDGGRMVAAVRLDDGRWAACNAFPEQAGASRAEVERRLQKLLGKTHGRRRGVIGTLPGKAKKNAAP